MKKDLEDYGLSRVLTTDEPGYEYLKDSKLIGKMLSAIIYDPNTNESNNQPKVEQQIVEKGEDDSSEFNEEDFLLKENDENDKKKPKK